MITLTYLCINLSLLLCVNVVVYNRDYFKKFLDMYKDLEIATRCYQMHWCFKYEFVWPLSALVFLMTLLHHFHHETLPTTVTTYERGCPWQMIGFTLLTNTLAPWN